MIWYDCGILLIVVGFCSGLFVEDHCCPLLVVPGYLLRFSVGHFCCLRFIVVSCCSLLFADVHCSWIDIMPIHHSILTRNPKINIPKLKISVQKWSHSKIRPKSQFTWFLYSSLNFVWNDDFEYFCEWLHFSKILAPEELLMKFLSFGTMIFVFYTIR